MTRTDHELEAHQRGVQAAIAAASWVIDGNATQDHYRALLKMIDDGDPRVDEFLPATPNLSGEWADDLTPQSLTEEIIDMDTARFFLTEDEIARTVDEITNAFEDGVSDTFIPECERLVRAALA